MYDALQYDLHNKDRALQGQWYDPWIPFVGEICNPDYLVRSVLQQTDTPCELYGLLYCGAMLPCEDGSVTHLWAARNGYAATLCALQMICLEARARDEASKREAAKHGAAKRDAVKRVYYSVGDPRNKPSKHHCWVFRPLYGVNERAWPAEPTAARGDLCGPDSASVSAPALDPEVASGYAIGAVMTVTAGVGSHAIEAAAAGCADAAGDAAGCADAADGGFVVVDGSSDGGSTLAADSGSGDFDFDFIEVE